MFRQRTSSNGSPALRIHPRPIFAALIALAGLTSPSPAAPEVVITYESYDDLTPDDPSIDLCLDCSATIEVWITPTGESDSSIHSAAFAYQGEVNFEEHTVASGGILLHDHYWSEPYQNPSFWFTVNVLPNPQVTNFSCFGFSVTEDGFLLSTLNVTATAPGIWGQITGPQGFLAVGCEHLPLAPGSDTFEVAVGLEFCLDGGGDPDPDDDCNHNNIHDICDILNETSGDCNLNSTPDECDVNDGTSEDCNSNVVPDECETGYDCNNNDHPDDCDIDGGSSGDCNENDIPDECETELDCNGNQRPDICDLEDGSSGDCNENEIPDECDIESGESTDNNMDTIPDECGPHFPYELYFDCVSDPGGGVPGGCNHYDMDRDDDVDLIDYSLFQIEQGGCGLVIRQPPVDTNVCMGGVAALTVEAVGPLLDYQWMFNGEGIPGQNDPTIIINNAKPNQTGIYACEVATHCGSIELTGAELTVSEDIPTITHHPRDAEICEGDSHFMYAGATEYPSFIWFHDGQPIPSITTAFYAIASATEQDAGTYLAVAVNDCGQTETNQAVIEVIDCED